MTRVILFWEAFILTRPLGTTIGDFLDKPIAKGGLEFSRPLATTVLASAIVLLILILPQRAGRHPGTSMIGFATYVRISDPVEGETGLSSSIAG